RHDLELFPEIETRAADAGLVHRAEVVVGGVVVHDHDPAIVGPAFERINHNAVVGAVGGGLDEDATLQPQGAVHAFDRIGIGFGIRHVGGAGARRVTIDRTEDMSLAVAASRRWRLRRLAGVAAEFGERAHIFLPYCQLRASSRTLPRSNLLISSIRSLVTTLLACSGRVMTPSSWNMLM